MTDNTQIIPVFKPEGITPLQLIELLRAKQPELKDLKISYAGRLDPMAEGLMLLVVGDQTHKESLLHVDKVYEFQLILGIETDTHDVLGIIQQKNDIKSETIFSDEIQKFLPSLIGKQSQTYPAYSSKTVDGKSLFSYARANKLDSITIPTKEIEVYSLELKNSTTHSKDEITNRIAQRISSVEGDFRQSEILQQWEEYLSKTSRINFQVFSLTIHSSTGTYVRSIVHKIGKMIGCGAVTWSIRRTKVGDYSLSDSRTIYV